MTQVLFQGVCTALVTPFYNDTINYDMLEKLIMRQTSNGVSTIVLAGTTGEAPTLTDREKIQLFREGKTLAGRDCKVIAGTGSNSTAHTVELSIAAQEAGADALLIVSPYYNKANNDGLVRHYCSIAESVNIPIILYNVPSRTGLDIPVSVYKQLADIPNIAGVKEASSDITKITKILDKCPNSFAVWTGNDTHVVPAVALGAQGVISVAANVFPAEMVTMVNAALNSNLLTASYLQRKLQSANELLFSEVNPIPVKAAMGIIGFECGSCRLPLGYPNQNTIAKLQTELLSKSN